MCNFSFVSPQKKTFYFLQTFRNACLAHSDSNVGPVRYFLTGIMQNIFRGYEKNSIINTHNLIYKPTKSLNKLQ